MNFAGLDIGTTGAKAIVVNHKGAAIASAYQSYPLLTPREGWCELNPEDLWSACKKVLLDVSSQCPEGFDALAVSSHAQAVVPINSAGKPLYNFIATVDTRTGEELAFWKETKDEKQIYLKTGLPFSAIYTANKLLWLKRHEADAFYRAERFMCVQDFVNWKLTGQAVMDITLASRGMLLNVHTQKWDDEILDIIGIRETVLSKIIPSGVQIGHPLKNLAEELHLKKTLCIVSGGHDQMCGCIGSGVLHPGQIMNSSGTVEVLGAISPEFISNDEILTYHYPCSPYITGNNHLVMSINNSGGLLLQWYINTFCGDEKQKAIAEGADPYSYVINNSADSISNVYILPHLNGAETPLQDPDSACSMVHLRINTTKAEITRGLLDSMAYEMRLNLEAFQHIGCAAKEIRAIGGGAQSAKLLQIKADVTQLPIASLSTRESAGLGAAIISAVGMRAFDSHKDAIRSMVKVGRVFEPNVKLAAEYTEHFAEYKHLYPSLKTFNRMVSARVRRGDEDR